MESYYDKDIYLPALNSQGEITGGVERWKAHREGILHQAFTLALTFEGKVLCQKRHHPVFGGFWDLSASSHPQWQNGVVVRSIDMLLPTVEREWSLPEGFVMEQPRRLGEIKYKAQHHDFIEHELCEFFCAEINLIPGYQPEVASDQQCCLPQNIQSLTPLAPWVEEAINAGVLAELDI
ncbi:MAG: hypothetical protein CMF25_07065 [Kangiellaceae bacterium]|jgi:isopentenyldiphosphate isomerase|nr:hypothetical protein [Kangiellaceae bacterium]|tara:strand:- start:7749 stop:8285 length:537 start_codon:yes stop_codon:yes gene_type:complete